MIPDTPRGTLVTTDVPGRLDALGWSRWHQRLILALGITWILDGLEASRVANVAPTLQHPDTLGLSATQIGIANSVYLLGQVVGALAFGHLTDRLPAPGRTSISGEYSAINSAIDEMVPARMRGAIALAVNGSYWVGV